LTAIKGESANAANNPRLFMSPLRSSCLTIILINVTKVNPIGWTYQQLLWHPVLVLLTEARVDEVRIWKSVEIGGEGSLPDCYRSP
jgi:hypothetical protein